MSPLISRPNRNRREQAGRKRWIAPMQPERLEDRRLLSGYAQINLVGFAPGTAHHTDPNLNGWGMDHAPNGPWCVANPFIGVATFYNRNGKILPTVITVPRVSTRFGPKGTPTGIVFNPTSDWVISEAGRSAPATFLFDSLDGSISGWNPAVDPTHAITIVNNSGQGSVYTGLVIAQNSHGQNVLYAADAGSNSRVDMFNGQFQKLGSFTDPKVATQFPGNHAYQVEDVGGRLFVTFAKLPPPWGGVVDVFDTDGNLLTPNHFAANAPGAGPLQSPWGIVQAPPDFGAFSDDILIGNVEGAGNINAFDPVTGAFLGPLRHPDGTPIAIAGLWDLGFGDGGKNDGKTNDLFFDAGVNGVQRVGNGLFGRINAAGSDDASGQSPTAASSTPSVLGGDSADNGGPLQDHKDVLDRLFA